MTVTGERARAEDKKVIADTPAAADRWYVVQTLPHREAKAEMQLKAQGFRTFLPRYSKTVRHARKLRTVSAPFFPRYMFVKLDLSRERWRSVNGTFGVAGMVMGDEKPLPVPPGLVETLISAASADGHLRFGDRLNLGEPVRVLSGPFAELVGKIARFDGGGRVQVLLEIMGGPIPVQIAADALAPARVA